MTERKYSLRQRRKQRLLAFRCRYSILPSLTTGNSDRYSDLVEGFGQSVYNFIANVEKNCLLTLPNLSQGTFKSGACGQKFTGDVIRRCRASPMRKVTRLAEQPETDGSPSGL